MNIFTHFFLQGKKYSPVKVNLFQNLRLRSDKELSNGELTILLGIYPNPNDIHTLGFFTSRDRISTCGHNQHLYCISY